MKTTRRLNQFILVCIDVAFLVLALFASLAIRNAGWPSAEYWAMHIASFRYIFVAWVVVLYTAGLYNPDMAFDGLVFVGRLFWSIVAATLISALYFYLNSDTPIEPKTLLALDGLVSGLFIWMGRYLYSLAARSYYPKRPIAFVGWDPIVADLIAETRKRPQYGYEAIALLDEGHQAPPMPGVDVYPDRESFVWNTVHRDVRLVIIADERSLSEDTRSALFSLIGLPARFMRLPEFYETLLQKVPVGTINDLWFLENIDLRSKKPYEAAKRGIDILMALFGIVATLVLFPFIALAIKLSGRGPIFFTQKRLGKGGRPFTILKFRTMRTDCNDYSPTGESDPRITVVGNFLRRSRLDELPQTINILVGDMSFIGPRPERPELVEELERKIPYYRQRLLVKPGMTGWDQVNGEYHSATVEDTYKKLQYDLYYVKNMSVFLDLSIFFKTILTVFLRAGR
ncbi:MAG: sugar transferase [Spirochaetaceae bacterium]|nr:sugar transferase [Spirochaetaceae bacterium]